MVTLTRCGAWWSPSPVWPWSWPAVQAQPRFRSTRSGRSLCRASTGRFPDGVAFDPVTSRVLVSNKDGGTVTVVDAKTLDPLGSVAVGGDVGNVQTSGDRAVVGVGQANELLELDSASLRVI